jgi:hypothetical protein
MRRLHEGTDILHIYDCIHLRKVPDPISVVLESLGIRGTPSALILLDQKTAAVSIRYHDRDMVRQATAAPEERCSHDEECSLQCLSHFLNRTRLLDLFL